MINQYLYKPVCWFAGWLNNDVVGPLLNALEPNKLPVVGWAVDVAPKVLPVPKAGVVIWKPVLVGLLPKKPFELVDVLVPKPKPVVVCVDPRPNAGLFCPKRLF